VQVTPSSRTWWEVEASPATTEVFLGAHMDRLHGLVCAPSTASSSVVWKQVCGSSGVQVDWPV
jgi:hypothetical protein